MIDRRKLVKVGIVIILILSVWTAYPLFSSQCKLNIQRINLTGLPQVSVYFTLTDGMGKSILGISENELSISIDGTAQKISKLQSALEGGEFLAVSLVIDRSGSMKDSMPKAKEAAVNFVKRMSESDRLSLVTFDDHVLVNAGFSDDKEMIKKDIKDIPLGKDTALYDGVAQSLGLFENEATKRQAVIILSDGKDNRSQNSKDNILAEAQKKKISLFTIGLGNEIEEKALVDLASETGGAFFKAAEAGDLLRLYQTIADQLNNQYKLIFTSTYGKDDSWHDLKIIYQDPSGEDFHTSRTFLATTSPGVARGSLIKVEREGNQKQIMTAAGIGFILGLVLALVILILIKITRPDTEFRAVYIIGIILTAVILGGIMGFLLFIYTQ